MADLEKSLTQRRMVAEENKDEASLDSMAAEMGWDQPDEEALDPKQEEQKHVEKFNELEVKEKQLVKSEKEQEGNPDTPLFIETGLASAKAVVGGMAKAGDNTVNAIQSVANGIEDLAKDFGYGDGTIIDEEKWSNMADEYFPTNTPIDKLGRITGQYLLPYGAFSKVASLAGWSNKAAIFGSAVFDATINTPEDGRLSDALNAFPAMRPFVVEALLTEESDSDLKSRTKTFIETLAFGSAIHGTIKGIQFIAEQFGNGLAAAKNISKGKKIADAEVPPDLPPDNVVPPGASPQKKATAGEPGQMVNEEAVPPGGAPPDEPPPPGASPQKKADQFTQKRLLREMDALKKESQELGKVKGGGDAYYANRKKMWAKRKQMDAAGIGDSPDDIANIAAMKERLKKAFKPRLVDGEPKAKSIMEEVDDAIIEVQKIPDDEIEKMAKEAGKSTDDIRDKLLDDIIDAKLNEGKPPLTPKPQVADNVVSISKDIGPVSEKNIVEFSKPIQNVQNRFHAKLDKLGRQIGEAKTEEQIEAIELEISKLYQSTGIKIEKLGANSQGVGIIKVPREGGGAYYVSRNDIKFSKSGKIGDAVTMKRPQVIDDLDQHFNEQPPPPPKEGVNVKGKGDGPSVTPLTPKQIEALRNSNDLEEITEALGLRGDDWEAAASEYSRRGSITNEQTIANAKVLARSKGAIDEIINSKPGTALNAEQVTVARFLLAREILNFDDVITKLDDIPFAELSDAKKVIFIDAQDKLFNVVGTVQGFAAESGRATQAFNISFGKLYNGLRGEAEKAQLILKYAKSGGKGMADNYRMFKKLSNMSPEQAIKAVDKISKRSGKWAMVNAMLYEFWMNNIIGLISHGRNIVGNVSKIVISPLETSIGSVFSALRRTEDGIKITEAWDQLSGSFASIPEAARTSFHSALKEELPAGWLEKFAEGQERTLTGANLAHLFGISKEGKVAKGLEVIAAGSTLSLRGLRAEDAAAKVWHYRGSLRQQVNRELTAQGLSRGTKEYKAAAAKMLADPPAHVLDEATRIANEMTFTSPIVRYGKDGQIVGSNVFMGMPIQKGGDAIRSLFNEAGIPLVGKMMTSFGNIAANLGDVAIQRMPGFAFLSPRFRQMWNAGGAQKDLALARMTLGGSVLGYFTYESIQGNMTGSRGDRRQMSALGDAATPQYSWKVGDTYYKVDKDNPIGAMMAIGGDLGEIWNHIPEGDIEKASYLANAAALIIGDVYIPEYLTDMFSGFADMQEKVEAGEGGAAFNKFMADMSAGFQPYSATQRDIKRKMLGGVKEDPRAEEKGLYGTWESMKKQWIKDNLFTDGELPKQYNVWGDQVTYPPGLGFDVFSPIYMVKQSKDPVDIEIERLRMADPVVSTKATPGEAHLKLYMPNRSIRISKSGQTFVHEMTPKEYSKFVLLSAGKGKAFEEKGIPPLKDALRYQIANDYPALHSIRTDEAKKLVILKLVREYRNAASKAMITENKNIVEDFMKQGNLRKDAVLGTTPNENIGGGIAP